MLDELRSVATFEPDGTVTVDLMKSPSAVETIGAALAERLRPMALSVLYTWDNADDGILAHIVARELGIRAAVFVVDEGLIQADAALVHGEVALVVVEGPDQLRFDALRRFVSAHGGRLAVVAQLMAGPPPHHDSERIVFLAGNEWLDG